MGGLILFISAAMECLLTRLRVASGHRTKADDKSSQGYPEDEGMERRSVVLVLTVLMRGEDKEEQRMHRSWRDGIVILGVAMSG